MSDRMKQLKKNQQIKIHADSKIKALPREQSQYRTKKLAVMVKRLETLDDIVAIQKQCEGAATDKGVADLFNLGYKEINSTRNMNELAQSVSASNHEA